MSEFTQLLFREDDISLFKKAFVYLDGPNLIIKKKKRLYRSIDMRKALCVLPDDLTNTFHIEYQEKFLCFKCESGKECEDWISKLIEAMKLPSSNEFSFDDFIVLKILRDGQYEKDQLIEHSMTKKKYFLRKISKTILSQTGFINSSLDNKDLIVSIKHPYLASIIYTLATNTSIFLCTNYFPIGNLFDRIHREENPLPIEAIKFYTAELCESIGYLHSIGIIHGDLKPENIFIDDDGNLRVFGFGLHKYNENYVNCKPDYAAPEIIKGCNYNASIDWWSLGVIVYEMIFQKTPFYNNEMSVMLNNIVSNEIVFPEKEDLSKIEGLTDVCLEFINSLLVKNPDYRLGSNDDFKMIENHPFFDGFNFDALRKGELKNKWDPVLKFSVMYNEYERRMPPSMNYSKSDIQNQPETDT